MGITRAGWCYLSNIDGVPEVGQNGVVDQKVGRVAMLNLLLGPLASLLAIAFWLAVFFCVVAAFFGDVLAKYWPILAISYAVGVYLQHKLDRFIEKHDP